MAPQTRLSSPDQMKGGINLVHFVNVTMAYGTHTVIDKLNLHVKEGQLVVLIGPSGCGKTTTLQLINRLIKPTEGDILVNGQNIKNVNPVELRRKIGYVIQEIGLFPHMTIKQNIEIVPRLLGWDEERKAARTNELIQLVNLDKKYLKRYPSELSGGQQQRIGLLRALAVEPPIILMDEPFGALDPITRESLQNEIVALQKRLKKTIVFVTHDMDEAIKIAEQIVLMKDGKIVQAAAPKELLSNPANEFVEQFIGRHRLYRKADTVADVMSDEIVCAKKTLSLVEAVALMRHKKVPGLFVIDDTKKLLGKVSVEQIRKSGLFEQDALETIGIEQIRPAFEKQSAREVFDRMEAEKIDALPVVDEANTVIGVVTRSSIVRSLADVVWGNQS